MGTPTAQALARVSDGTAEMEGIEAFFHGPFADIIIEPGRDDMCPKKDVENGKMRFDNFKRNRAIIFTMMAIFMGLFIGLASQLEPTKSSQQFLPDDHPIQVIFDILTNEFPSSADDSGIGIYLGNPFLFYTPVTPSPGCTRGINSVGL